MTRKMKTVSLAIVLATVSVSATAWAKEITFKQFATNIPCAAEVRSKIPERLQKSQLWLFAERPSNGWEFRDTIDMKAYIIDWKDWADWPSRKRGQSVLIEHPIFVKSGSAQRTVWDPAKNCAAETSTEQYDPQPMPRLSSVGFSDDDLKSLLGGRGWGVIYLASPRSPGLGSTWLKAVKAVVEEKGGHLTVVLASSEVSADDKVGFTAEQLQHLRTNAGISASDLKPLASREIFDRDLHSGSASTAFVYLNGFLSNRPLGEQHTLADTRKAIQRELDDLKNDLNSN